MTTKLQSRWDGLNDHLIAEFFAVKRFYDDKNPERISYERVADSVVVRAPLSDVSIQGTLGWRDPFSDAGPDNRAPTLTAMLQSGALQPFVSAIIPGKDATDYAKNLLREYDGRTGITKLNSMQVFSGMEPVKISCVAHFRAWSDAAKEVEQGFNQLMYWAMPEKLSEEGSFVARVANNINADESNSKSMAELVMPSRAPTIVGMTFKGRTFMPLVIESIELPFSGPINANGHFVQMPVSLQLSTLTAIDRDDWRNYLMNSNL